MDGVVKFGPIIIPRYPNRKGGRGGDLFFEKSHKLLKNSKLLYTTGLLSGNLRSLRVFYYCPWNF